MLILHCVLTMRNHGHGRENDNNIQLSFNISSNGSSISKFYINNLIIKSPVLVVGSGFTFPGSIKFFVSSTKSGITPVTLIIASHSFTSAYEEGVDFRHVHVGAGAERWINWYINSLSSEHLIISSLLSSWSHSRLSDYSSSAYQLWKSLILPTNHPPTTMGDPATPPLSWPWKLLDQMPIQLSDHLCIIDAGRVVAALVHHKHFAR